MADRPPVHPPAPAHEGFTLLGLMVVIAVMNIGLAVAVTSWVTIGKRADEIELIWRGQQYARALACHRQQTGALPDTLDEMLDSDCLRALYPDPMSADGQWNIIHETDLQLENAGAGGGNRSAADVLDGIDRELRGPEAFFGGGGGGGDRGGGNRGGGTGVGGGGELGLGAGLGASTNETASLQASLERLRGMSQRISQNFSRSRGNGIVGVASRSTDEALRVYNGELTYDAWRFMADGSGGAGGSTGAVPLPGVGPPPGAGR